MGSGTARAQLRRAGRASRATVPQDVGGLEAGEPHQGAGSLSSPKAPDHIYPQLLSPFYLCCPMPASGGADWRPHLLLELESHQSRAQRKPYQQQCVQLGVGVLQTEGRPQIGSGTSKRADSLNRAPVLTRRDIRQQEEHRKSTAWLGPSVGLSQSLLE